MADPPPLMHATQVARPFHTKGWVYEEKYDGWQKRGRASPLDPVDRDSPLGQPGADLPPRLGLAPLPGVHALLRNHELREVIPPHRLDQTREIGAGAPQLEQQSIRGDADRGRRGSGQDASGGDA